MNIKKAIKNLENHNKWRKGKYDKMIKPKKLSESIDLIINEIKKHI
ncbi:MAG: hypothetical protein PX635_00920 [Nostocales cyanobacterium LE14-WE12]|jgi:hypothetical protein|nr:hypothetical protein [Nostocales cyanobacterium LE14-WE12]